MFRKLTIVVFLIALNAQAHGNLKLINGRWYDGERFVPRTMFVVDNVFRAQHEGEARVIDLAGKFVVPPFADAHNHVLADSPRVDEELLRYLRAGIFYVKNPNNSASRAAATRKRMNTPRPSTCSTRTEASPRPAVTRARSTRASARASPMRGSPRIPSKR